MSSPNAPPDKRRVASRHSKRLCSRLREIEQLRSSIWIVIIIWSQSYFELQIKIWKRTRSSQWSEQAKRLKRTWKQKIRLDRESNPDVCDDWTQRSIHWGNIWFIRILQHLYQITLRPVNANVRVRFPVTPEFFQFLFQLLLGCSFPCKKHVHLDHVHFHGVLYVQFSLLFPLKVTRGRAQGS